MHRVAVNGLLHTTFCLDLLLLCLLPRCNWPPITFIYCICALMSDACIVLFGFILLYNPILAYRNTVSFTQGQSGSDCSAGKWLRWDSVKIISPHSVIYTQNYSNTLPFIKWHKHPCVDTHFSCLANVTSFRKNCRCSSCCSRNF